MAERDEHIQDKERKVYDLKKRNQELEKFKFVLDFRIKELKEQVEPKENEIEDMSGQIQDINLELEKLCKQKQHLEETIENLKSALSSKKQSYMKEHIKAHNLSRQIKYFRTDLQDAISYFQDPILLKVDTFPTKVNIIFRNPYPTFGKDIVQKQKISIMQSWILN